MAVDLDKCIGSCSIFNHLSNRVCVPDKTKDLDLKVFNMITGINKLKTLTKHVSCKCKCKLDGRKCNSNQNRNNDKCWCDCTNLKKHHVCKKNYIWNAATCSYENGKYLGSIIDDSLIKCDEIIKAADCISTNVMSTASTNFCNKKVRYKMDCNILHTLLLVIYL